MHARSLFAAGLAAGLLAALAGPAAGIEYPVDVPGTAGQWARWHCPDQTCTAGPGELYDRGLTWPRPDGEALVGASPYYHWLLESRVEPPETDSRFRGYVCGGAVPDLAAATLITTCQAPVLDADSLRAAVSAVAAERLDTAARRVGIRSPADLLEAITALERRSRGVPLTERQEALLEMVGDTTAEWIATTQAREAELLAWVDAHPGQVPDVSEASWPPLPPAAAGAE